MSIEKLTLEQLKTARPDLVQAVADDAVSNWMNETAKTIAKDEGIPYAEAMIRVVSAWERHEAPKAKTAKVVPVVVKAQGKTPAAPVDRQTLVDGYMVENPDATQEQATAAVNEALGDE